MRKAAKQLLICAAALILLCVASRFAFFNGLSLYVPAAYFTGNEGQAAGAAAEKTAAKRSWKSLIAMQLLFSWKRFLKKLSAAGSQLPPDIWQFLCVLFAS